jgi:hypothetical protein
MKEEENGEQAAGLRICDKLGLCARMKMVASSQTLMMLQMNESDIARRKACANKRPEKARKEAARARARQQQAQSSGIHGTGRRLTRMLLLLLLLLLLLKL